MRCFVTGAAGFIGSHLITQLLADGHEVTGLDDFSTGREQNLAAVAGQPRFTLVRGSILDQTLVYRLTAGADCVFHLAAAVGAFVIRDKTLDSMRTNIDGTEHVVAAATRHRARLLVASTSEIYGKNTTIGLREDDDRVIGSPLKSRWSYAEAKAIDESLVNAYVQERGLRGVIVRLFNTVGPGQTGRYGMVIPRFARQALTGQPLTVFGTGEQIRCFCHVLDVVPALIALVQSDAAVGKAVNLGSSEQVSIGELARLVIAATGSASGIERATYLAAYGPGYEDMQRRVVQDASDCRVVPFATGNVGNARHEAQVGGAQFGHAGRYVGGQVVRVLRFDGARPAQPVDPRRHFVHVLAVGKHRRGVVLHAPERHRGHYQCVPCWWRQPGHQSERHERDGYHGKDRPDHPCRHLAFRAARARLALRPRPVGSTLDIAFSGSVRLPLPCPAPTAGRL